MSLVVVLGVTRYGSKAVSRRNGANERGLKAQVAWIPQPGGVRPPPSWEQGYLEAPTLALCVMAVAKIDRDPSKLDLVYRNFER